MYRFLPRAPHVGLPHMAHARTRAIVERIGLLMVLLLGASSQLMSVAYVYLLTAGEHIFSCRYNLFNHPIDTLSTAETIKLSHYPVLVALTKYAADGTG